MRRHPTIPRMVTRALFHWWTPASDGDGWAQIDEAWCAISRAFDRALELYDDGKAS